MAELYEKLNRSLQNNKPTRETEVILKTELDINALDDKGNALLHYIAEENNIALIEIIIEKRKDLNLDIVSNEDNCKHETALLKSIDSKNTEVSKTLINAGADVNLRDYFKITPLLASITNNNTELATILINSGADTNLSDCCKNSPLLQAVKNDNTELVEILINAGADVNFRNRDKNTPLHETMLYNNLQIATALIQHNAYINAKNEIGETPLLILLCRSEDFNSKHHLMLDLLLNHGAFWDLYDQDVPVPYN